jgi:putative hemolysin
MSEMAVVTSRKARLKQLAESSTGARRALALSENPERFLSTVQVGITLIPYLNGIVGGEAFGLVLGAWLDEAVPALAPATAMTIGNIIVAVVVTFVTIVFGELVPKRFAIAHPERIASLVALPMSIVALVGTPAVWLLSLCTRTTLRLLGLRDNDTAAVTEEEIRMMVSEAHDAGVFDAGERNMVNRVLGLGDRTAESLMTPRTRIAWLDVEAGLEENLATMAETPYSRYPVQRGGDAEVVGILEVKALAGRLGRPDPDLFRELRPALFVSESTGALKLLEIFREEQQPLALVVDEYGDIQGMVTANDVLHAVIGRTQTHEGHDADPLVVTREDGSMLVDGGLPTEDLRELLGLGALPDEEDHDYNTLAGMVIARYGRIPHVGEHFEFSGWRFEVIDLDGPRVDKLLVARVAAADPAAADAAS